MGAYTNRSTIWEIVNSWWLTIMVFSFGFFPFVGFLYVGLMGKRNRWIIAGLLSLAILSTALILKFSAISILLIIANWGASIAYSLFINQEFLQRIDAISRGIEVPRNKAYIGTSSLSFQTSKTIGNEINTDRENSSHMGQQFIASLKKWEMAIDSANLRNSIKRLTEISQQIVKKESMESDKFFIRYAEPIDQLLAKYDAIENSGLNNERAVKSMHEVESFMGKIVTVFEKEYTNLFKTDLLDIETSVEAFTQSLKNRGLIDEDYSQSIKNTPS